MKKTIMYLRHYKDWDDFHPETFQGEINAENLNEKISMMWELVNVLPSYSSQISFQYGEDEFENAFHVYIDSGKIQMHDGGEMGPCYEGRDPIEATVYLKGYLKGKGW